ncbi:MAG: F0F1 ATP synthase subunit B [Paludibacteraceae bacterium]|nr:F0F1 ATP synthase subunit B [Paludibacteraceae bacterium]
MDLFLPESGLVVWMLLAFGIVFAVLAKFGWPIILNSLQKREEHIAESLKKAEEAIETLSGLEQKGKDIIASAEAEQIKMVGETKTLNQKMIDDAKAEATREADKIIASAREQIVKEKEAAIAELNQEVVKLSVQMAEKILLRELKDRKAQSDYVETLLKDNSLS